MVYSEKMEHYVARIVERIIAGRYSERHALVTSYDPKNYRAKVTFQPGGQTSGWLPIETGHIGNGYGMAVGLEAGDGKKTGDQVICRFQENDFECAKIVQRVHSDKDKPPGPVESGEWVMWTKWGQQIRFNKDGSLTFKTGVDTTQDPGNKQPKHKKVTVTLDINGNHTIQADTNIAETATSGQITNNAGQSWTSTAPTVNTVGQTHLGTTTGALVSMTGTIDTGGFADIPPVASRVFAS
jgi:hypothetical protein